MQSLERLVRIGDLRADSNIFSLVCRDSNPTRAANRQRQAADQLRLLFDERRGPSVVRPGVVVERQHSCKIAPPIPYRERDILDLRRPASGRQPRKALGKVGFGDTARIGEQVHRFGVAERLDMPSVMWRRMVGANDMRLIKPMNQKTTFMVDRETEGPARGFHPVRQEKPLRFSKQPCKYCSIVDRVDETEKSAAVVEFGDVPSVDRSDDPSHRLAVSQRDERLY